MFNALPAVTAQDLNLSSMIGATIEYAYTQNLDGTPDMVEVGTIASVRELKGGELEMYVVPQNPNRMAKYRIAETHLLRYVNNVKGVIEAEIA
jgi:hypothetical protein